MKEGRKELVIDTLEVKKVARRKAGIQTIITMIFVIILILIVGIFSGEYSKSQIIAISLPVIALLIFLYSMLYKVYQDEVVQKLNKEFVDQCLEEGKVIEVVPIDADEHYKKFIFGLVNVAKFYAVQAVESDAKEFAEIWVKFNNEEVLRYLEHINKGCFTKYYSILEEDGKVKKYKFKVIK